MNTESLRGLWLLVDDLRDDAVAVCDLKVAALLSAYADKLQSLLNQAPVVSQGLTAEGWVVVPREPTREMVQAACDAIGYPGGDRTVYSRGYRHMLSAAPAAQPSRKYQGDPAGPRDDSDRYCKHCPAGEASLGKAPTTLEAADGWVMAPMVPTREQLHAARDWSIKTIGRAVGNEHASGCYRSMLSTLPAVEVDEGRELIGYAPFCIAFGDKAHARLEYVGSAQSDVLSYVLAHARREGFKGSAKERMHEMGWEIRPIYAETALAAALGREVDRG